MSEQMVDRTAVTRKLPVALSHDEQRDLIQQQYVAEADIEAAKAERAENNKAINRRIADNQKKITQIKRDIAAGAQEREVACEELRDYARNMVSVVRLDTSEAVEERALTPEERQAGLGFGRTEAA
ncbi:MAG: hypothetical protein HY794_13470 [Desulfarculus sp.]|nr:hypothetical protein [Desulfarculus sp.]